MKAPHTLHWNRKMQISASKWQTSSQLPQEPHRCIIFEKQNLRRNITISTSLQDRPAVSNGKNYPWSSEEPSIHYIQLLTRQYPIFQCQKRFSIWRIIAQETHAISLLHICSFWVITSMKDHQSIITTAPHSQEQCLNDTIARILQSYITLLNRHRGCKILQILHCRVSSA